MNEIKKTLLVRNHRVMVDLPTDFNYKKVNVLITPYDINEAFSFDNQSFVPVKLKSNNQNLSTEVLREERDQR